jgi:hypothetical protein
MQKQIKKKLRPDIFNFFEEWEIRNFLVGFKARGITFIVQQIKDCHGKHFLN